MKRSLLAAAVLLAIGGASRDARATPSARLVYVRGTGTSACPDEAELRRAVATRLGYDPFFPTATKTVIAQITRAPKGYRGKVQIVGDDGNTRGERELATRGDDCAELVGALALAISIALDDLDDGKANAPPPEPRAPEPVAAADPPPQGALPGAGPPPESDAAPATAGAPALVPARRLGFAASLGPVVSFGVAPSPALGGAAHAELRYAGFAARLGVRADLPASRDIGGGVSVSTRSILASASVCVRGEVPFLCAGGGLGSFASTTDGIARPASDAALLANVLVHGGVDVALTRQLFVEPALEGSLVLTRHRVSVDGATTFTLPVFAGSGIVQIGWRFL